MSEVQSTFSLKPGDPAPAFVLPDSSGQMHTLDSLRGEKGTLIIFACNHCPYVIHLAKPVGRLANEFATLGIKTAAIMSNDVENYPADHPDKMGPFAAESGWEFPYLYDESQGVAKAWAAACTPDFYLLDAEGGLFYAGQYDSSRPKTEAPVTGEDLRAAAEALLAGGEPPADPFPSSGCNIKWKDGNEPPYFG
ncbi:MAG: thioredoxin family protein [Roseibacillus sp.]|jgi:peroxiredoxin